MHACMIHYLEFLTASLIPNNGNAKLNQRVPFGMPNEMVKLKKFLILKRITKIWHLDSWSNYAYHKTLDLSLEMTTRVWKFLGSHMHKIAWWGFINFI
jgi:hypothetical protein